MFYIIVSITNNLNQIRIISIKDNYQAIANDLDLCINEFKQDPEQSRIITIDEDTYTIQEKIKSSGWIYNSYYWLDKITFKLMTYYEPSDYNVLDSVYNVLEDLQSGAKVDLPNNGDKLINELKSNKLFLKNKKLLG